MRQLYARDPNAFWLVAFCAFFIVVGLVWATYPEKMLRWHLRGHTWVADEPSVVAFARWLGIAIAVFGGGLLFAIK